MNTIAHDSSIGSIAAGQAASSERQSSFETPLVSIIIPVYNGAKYISAAIESVVSQTYKHYEIIVIDDGSTDDTRQQLHPYHEQIRYVYQENKGSAAARNLGIKLAKGELIAFLDADDFWSMAEKLEKQVAQFRDRPSLGGINTGWQIVDRAGQTIKTVQPWHKAPKLDLETWLKKKCVRTSAMIFRRQWLEKVGGFDEELRQSHDVDLILRLSLAGCETEWLKEETVCYRQHESNTTKNSLKQAKYIQAVLDKFFARDDLPASIGKQESQIRYHTMVWIAWYQYHDDNLDQMTAFLQKSLKFSPYLLVENISHWLSAFERFSQERGEQFPTDVVTSSPQWHRLIATIIGLPVVTSRPTESSAAITPPQSPTAKSASSESQAKLETQPVAIPERANTQAKQVETDRQIAEHQTAKPALTTEAKLELDEAELENKSAAELVTLAAEKVKQQQEPTAIALYVRALKLEPDAWKTHRQLGKLYRQQGQLDLALTHLQQSIAIQPQIGEIHSDVGLTLAQLGKWDEAIAAYSRSIQIKPEQPWSYFKLAALQEKQHDFAAATESLHRAIEYNPNNSLFYRNLAQVQQLRGNLDESIVAYRQAIKTNPDLELTVYRNLGQAIKHNATVKPRLGLKQVAEALRARAGKIAYLGGSPTAQPDGYLSLLEPMLDSYFGSPQTTIKAANGGITSNAAVFTMEDDLIPQQPDLCLIEYSSTDMGKGYDVTQAVEGMVKKLLKIGCQVCFLYMYQEGGDFSGDDPVLIEYEKVAEFYGIPSINVGKQLEKLAKQNELEIANLFKGKEKTTPAGSQVVAEFVFAGLKEIFAAANQSQVDSFNHFHHQERYLSDRHYGEGKIVPIAPSMLIAPERYQRGDFRSYQYLQINLDNEIRFTIQGELVGITTIIGRDSGIMRLATENYHKEYQLWDAFCFEDRLQALTIQRYFERPTTVSLKLTTKPVDYSKCINKISNPHEITKSLRVVGLLVCGTIEQADKYESKH